MDPCVVEASDCDWSTAGQLVEDGVLVVRNLDVTPSELEAKLQVLGRGMMGGKKLLKYERWPGQSPAVTEHLALLGNYKAKKKNDIVACEKGDAIAEFKPATLDITEWHTDGSFLPEPKSAIALYAPMNGVLPAEGGETRFASCKRGFATLHPTMKARLGGSSVHSYEVFMRFLEQRDPSRPKATTFKPDQTWPLVRDGDCLYVNPKNTRSSPVDVLELARHIVDSGVYSHFWRPGDLVVWDNRKLLHAATPFDHHKYERLLYRAEFQGEVVKRRLFATPDTVVWGYFEERDPVMTVESGSIVKVDTVSGSEQVTPKKGDWNIPQELFDIHAQVTDRLGPHIITGPIAVTGAEPGDTLRIDVLDVELRSDFAWTFCPSRTGGGLRDTAPPGQDCPRFTRLGEGWAYPEWGGKLDLAPFFGIIATAPKGPRVNSIPPSEAYAGNLDCKLLTKGSTLYIPVHVPGALVFVGDGHARQGDGECCGTALETALSGTFKFTVLKQKIPLRAENATSLITLACRVDLDDAVKAAIHFMLDWLAELRPKLDRMDAYCLCSVAADLKVTQVVNGDVRGVHLVLDKAHLPAA